MNGGGIGPWLAKEAGNMMGGIMSGASFLSTKKKQSRAIVDPNYGTIDTGDSSAPSAASGGMNNQVVSNSINT